MPVMQSLAGTQDKKKTPSQDAQPDATKTTPDIKEFWKGLSREQRDAVIQKLSPEEQGKLLDALGGGHAEGVHASPEFSARSMGAILSGNLEADPWVRQKMQNLVYKGSRYLPSIGGTAGGILGAEAGTALAGTEGGTAVGAIAGSGILGGVGEAARQGIDRAMGWEDNEPLSTSDRVKNVAKAGVEQMVAETLGFGMGKLLNPTLERSINKLYFAGQFGYGDPRRGGAVESIFEDIAKVEKARPKGAKTVGDLIDVLDTTKKEIGQKVDLSMAQPITQNGRRVMLGQAVADTTGIQTEIRSLLTAHPSVVEEASIRPAGKAAAELQRIRDAADLYAQGNWTYSKLCDRRIRLNEELEAMYDLPAGEQRSYLLAHPDLLIKKKEADAIRELTYKQMDLASGHPIGTTAKLQEKRGVIMSLSNQAKRQLENLRTSSRIEAGAPVSQKINVSTYGTSSGKPGIAVHRLHRLLTLGRVTPESIANKRVAGAFGHTVGTKAGKVLGSRAGRELMALPMRVLTAPDAHDIPEEELETVPVSEQDASPTPQQLSAEAQERKPATPQRTYAHTATGPNGHKIGSDDGTNWFDLSTGQQVR